MKKKSDFDKDWEKYFKEFNVDLPWQMYLWKKNEQGQIVADLSEENLKRCEKLYVQYPHDENNFIRFLLLKIFSGQECRDLPSRMLDYIEKKKENLVYDIAFYLVLNDELYSAIKPFIPRLKSFLLWLNDLKPGLFKNLIYDIETAGLVLSPLCKIVGTANVFENNIDLSEILSIDVDTIGEGYFECYVFAEYCYEQAAWFEAFCLFEKMNIYNRTREITNEALQGEIIMFKDKNAFADTNCNLPTLEKIDERLKDCFDKVIENGLSELLLEYIIGADKFKEIYKYKVGVHEKQLKNHLLVYEIFSAYTAGDYKKAAAKFDELDKKWLEFLGSGYSAVKERLKKEDIKEKLLTLFNEDDLIIRQLELRAREFVSESLKKYYKGDKRGWNEGVKLNIRRVARGRQEEDPRASIWACLDFFDYAEIIKNNWANIFCHYFEFEKDCLKGKEKNTQFLKDSEPFRNIFAHHKRLLTKKESKVLKKCSEFFAEIYQRWRETIDNERTEPVK